VIFGKERGYIQIIFEGDAMQIVQAIKDNNTLQRCYGHFVKGIQAKLQMMGKGIFNCVARKANGDAHVLAKLATTYVIDKTWVEVTPPGICGIIRREGTVPLCDMFFDL
jgi:hypothetical protein